MLNTENLRKNFSLHDDNGYHDVAIISVENEALDEQTLQYNDLVSIDSEYFSTHAVSFIGDDCTYKLSGDVNVQHIDSSASEMILISGYDQDSEMASAFFINLEL